MAENSAHAFTVADDIAGDSYREVDRVEDIGHPLLAEVFTYWRTLAAGRSMPLARDVDPIDIPRQALGYVFLLDVERHEAGLRFRVRLAGSQAVEQAGFDPTGRYGEDVPGSEPVAARLTRAVESRRAYVADVPLTWSSRNYKRYLTLVCPLAAGDVPEGTVPEVVRLLAVVLFH